jgi:hypothetical protein
MESLAKALYTCTASAADEFITRVAKRFNIDKSQLLDEWNNGTSNEVNITETKKTAKKSTSSAAKKIDSDSKKCIYKFAKGEKAGQNCGSRVCEESVTENYCKKHIAQESRGEKEKKHTTAKKTNVKKAEAKEAEVDSIKTLQTSVPVFSAKLNKFRRYEHEGTGLLIDKGTQEVYGKQHLNGSVIPLSAEDISLCKSHGFKYRLPDKLTSTTDKEIEGDEEPEVSDIEEEDDEEDS